MSRTTKLCASAVFVSFALCCVCVPFAVAEHKYTDEELDAAAQLQKTQIAEKNSELKAAKARLKIVARAKDASSTKAANAEITDLERSIRALRSRDVIAFADDIRHERDRKAAEAQQAQEAREAELARQRAREAARLEIARRPKIQPDTMKLGDQGFLQDADGEEYLLTVQFVREEGEGVLAHIHGTKSFIAVSGVALDGLVSNRWFSLQQKMKVVGTADFLADDAQATYFVVAPADPKETGVVMREAVQPKLRSGPRWIPPPYEGKVPITYP